MNIALKEPDMRTIPKLGKAMEKLKLDNKEQAWQEHWDDSQAVFPGRDLFFLDDDFIKEANLILGLPEDAVNAFFRVYKLIKSSEELTRLAWHLHLMLFERRLPEEELHKNWPSMSAALNDMSGMFSAAILASGFRKAMDFYDNRGIPHEILADTLSDFRMWMLDYYNAHGVWGLDSIGWLSNHFTCRLFRLGRLQFIPEIFGRKIKVYRNRKSRKVIAFSEAGVVYRRDGLADGTNGIFDTEGAWTARLSATAEYVTGNPILPFGTITKDTATIAMEEWDCVLSNGDPILEIHIPGGEKMSHELCGDSMEQAAGFFPRYIPECPFRAFTCGSWLLEPQLQYILPGSSNIVRFQKEFYLYPIKTDHRSVYKRIFGNSEVDIAQAPRNTTLQRAVAEYVLAGNHLHAGAGFILKDDMQWGTQTYINQYKQK
jgi:hypothetical protein